MPAASPSTPAAPRKLGFDVIADVVKRLPNGPGVYRMIDAKGDVLYVGKARNLKKRVQSYARPAGQSGRIHRAIMATASMEFVSTRTETEALLLEANLIKRLRPRFNVLLRDDKSFPYILITSDHPAPQIAKHRGARTRKGTYYGPFASAGAVARTIDALERAFLLRSCSDSVFESRTRPCLLFQIKRCSAPCTGEIEPAAYAELVSEANDFLSGKSQAVRGEIQQAMEQASERLDFEAAARYRDRLAALSHVSTHQGINPQGVDEADVFAVHQDGGQTCIEVFFFRTGQNWGNRAYYPRADKALEGAQVLGEFLAQFYDDKPTPKLILLSHEIEERALLEEALSERAGRRDHRHGAAAWREARPGRTCAVERARCARARRWRNRQVSARCSTAWRRSSTCPRRRSASRSTTTATSWAPMRSAAWSSPDRKGSSRRNIASSTSARRT